MDISYILNHLGEERESYFNAVSPPVVQTSNFYFKDVEALRSAFLNERVTPIYSRGNNPTVEILCKKIAALAGAEDALVFASGMAAISAAIISQVKAGDHVVCVKSPYSWTHKLLSSFLPRFGVETTFIDGTDPQNFADATRSNTTLYMLESPNTFTFQLLDIEAVVKIARQKGITTILDNSYCTSLGQRAFEMGVDIEVHSASKYYGGHSDIVAGLLISSKEIIDKIFPSEFLNLGGIISPQNAWLMIRSMRTLPLRLKQISETTGKLVAFMRAHPLVDKVVYPFDDSFTQYELAKKQMKWCGGLFTVLLKVDSAEQVETFCNNLKAFLLAVSWGGHESLVMPACSFSSRHQQDSAIYPYNMVRFYIGLEDADYLIADLKQAFELVN